MSQTAIEALAEAWASIDGKLSQYEADKLEGTDGRYAGYTAEAEEMITRLEKRGFTVSALSALPSQGGVKDEARNEAFDEIIQLAEREGFVSIQDVLTLKESKT